MTEFHDTPDAACQIMGASPYASDQGSLCLTHNRKFRECRSTRDTPEARRVALIRVLNDLEAEVLRAQAQHAPMHSPHEGWAVIREELEPELWEHVCHDTGRSPEARHEALQVAAMGVRYILDLIDTPQEASE
jgi:hypothetical protein